MLSVPQFVTAQVVNLNRRVNTPIADNSALMYHMGASQIAAKSLRHGDISSEARKTHNFLSNNKEQFIS